MMVQFYIHSQGVRWSSSDRDHWLQDFFGCEIFDSRIYLGVKFLIPGFIWVWNFRFQDLFGCEIFDSRIFLGVKFSIPGFIWVARIIWQVFFWVAWFKKGFKKVIASTVFSILLIQSNPVNINGHWGGHRQCPYYNGVFVLWGLNLEKM